jgi:sec-independent protein translocase protein TatA
MVAFFGLPGNTEWIIILIVALLLFGSRLPAVMRSLGKSVTEFKKGVREGDEEMEALEAGGEREENEERPPSPAG